MDRPNERIWLTVEEFRRRNPALKRTHLYEAVRNGTLPSVRIGKKILIPSDAIERMYEETYRRQEESQA